MVIAGLHLRGLLFVLPRFCFPLSFTSRIFLFYAFPLCSFLSIASFINVVLFTRLTVSGNAAPAAAVHIWLPVQTLECGYDKLLRHLESSHCTNSAVDPVFH